MISIARKNLSSFFSNPNFSFLCNSNAHFLPSIHHFSTAKLRRRLMKTPRPEIYDVLFRKHQFSFEFASSLAKAELTKYVTPERVDSVLSLLKENSFTNAQLEKILRYNAQILGYNVEGLCREIVLDAVCKSEDNEGRSGAVHGISIVRKNAEDDDELDDDVASH